MLACAMHASQCGCQAACVRLAFSLRQFRMSSLRSMRLLTLRPLPEVSSSTWNALLAFRAVMVDRLQDTLTHLNVTSLKDSASIVTIKQGAIHSGILNVRLHVKKNTRARQELRNRSLHKQMNWSHVPVPLWSPMVHGTCKMLMLKDKAQLAEISSPGDLVNGQHARGQDSLLLSRLPGIPLPLFRLACKAETL